MEGKSDKKEKSKSKVCIVVDDALMQSVRLCAVRKRTTISELVEVALKKYLIAECEKDCEK